MKKLILLVFGLGITGIFLQSFRMNQNTPYSKQQIEKGKYLVEIMGCRDCHSPKKMSSQGPVIDQDLDLSGHPESFPVGSINKEVLKDWVLFNGMNTAAVGPWGLSFAANLTSDATGIGNWSEKQFIVALTKGKSKGLENARDLLPPMPWQNYKNIKKEDAIAIFAYLKSTKPVQNVVPQPKGPSEI